MLDLAGLVAALAGGPGGAGTARRRRGRLRHPVRLVARPRWRRSSVRSCWSALLARPGGRPRQPGRRSTPPTAPGSTRAPTPCASPSASACRWTSAACGCSTPTGNPVQDGAARGRRRGGRGRPPARPARRHLRRELPGRLGRRPPRARGLGVRGGRRRGRHRARSAASPAAATTALWEVVGAIGRGLAYAGVLARRRRDRVPRPRAPRRRRARRARRGWCGPARWSARLASLVALPVQAALGTGQGPGSLFDDGVLGEVAKDGVGLGVRARHRRGWPSPASPSGVGRRSPWSARPWRPGRSPPTGTPGSGRHVALATVADVVPPLGRGGVGRRPRPPLAHPPRPPRRGRPHRHRRRRRTVLHPRHGRRSSSSGVTRRRPRRGRRSGRLDALTEHRLRPAAPRQGRRRRRRSPPSAPTTTSAWCRRSAAARPPPRSPSSGRRSASRSLLLAVVVAITSVLVVVTPARTEADGGGVVERIVELGDAGSVQLTVAPAQAGFNQIHLYLFDPDGRPAEIAESRHARDEPAVRRPRADHPRGRPGRPRALPARRHRPRRRRATGPSRSSARVDRFTEEAGTTEVPIAP